MIITSIQLNTFLLFEPVILVHVLLAVPAFIAAFVGLVGFGQLILGMRENRLLNFLIFVPAFAALYGSGLAVTRGLTVSWQYVGILLAASVLLIGLAAYLTRYLNRERIVTTIE
jgi:ABC-2 type transport system permease protein